MKGSDKEDNRNQEAKLRRLTATGCLVLILLVTAMGYAAVPLYSMFCKVTGYGGTIQRVEEYSNRILSRKIAVRFDGNTAGGLVWKFQPVERQITLKIGETAKIYYRAVNPSREPVSGRATFNVTPGSAGAYFNKIECFCFTDTTLQPGETLDMPVLFYIDPALADQPELKNLHTITLSYTFFPL